MNLNGALLYLQLLWTLLLRRKKYRNARHSLQNEKVPPMCREKKTGAYKSTAVNAQSVMTGIGLINRYGERMPKPNLRLNRRNLIIRIKFVRWI